MEQTNMSNEAHDNVLLSGATLAAAIRLVEIKEIEADLKDEKKRCKEILDQVLSVGERGVDKDNIAIVTVRKGAGRFSPERAHEFLPEAVYASICTISPDGKRAKEILAPVLYEECLEYNSASVVAL
jgi:hypothetical protein